MEHNRVFNVLELCCFPKGCVIPEELQNYLAMDLIPRLEAIGMTPAEWTRGALGLEEPHFSKVKSVVCRRCYHECPFGSRDIESPDGFSVLKNGNYADRIKKGDELLEQLLPKAKKEELSLRGIVSSSFQMVSRKKPKLYFIFTHNGNRREVKCNIGERLLYTNGASETLISVEQVSQKIANAISDLAGF